MYDPQKHHRRSIRLPGYNYAQPDLFFITLCVTNKKCLLGKVSHPEMVLNDAGRMIEKWYAELANKFPDIKCRDYVVMPNHFHCIIENTGGYIDSIHQKPILSDHAGSPLSSVVQWFKTMSTNEYIRNVKLNNWTRFDGRLWQRDYWEHIIRDDMSCNNITEYIINNPASWDKDEMNPGKGKQ